MTRLQVGDKVTNKHTKQTLTVKEVRQLGNKKRYTLSNGLEWDESEIKHYFRVKRW